MNNLYEILEICLREIENGADVETVLFRYPAQAEELRPILETSRMAKNVTPQPPSSEIVRRNRAKVLQHAAQMREAQVHSSRRLWSVPLRRAFATMMIVAALFSTGTGLVRASSTTLPGDNLYPVKRTWEDALILFAFDPQSREALMVEHQNERLDEVQELFSQGRSARVDFTGFVTRQNEGMWLVSGIPVLLSTQTRLPSQPIAIGSAVHVTGTTQKDGAVLAQQIDALPAGMPLPDAVTDDSSEVEQSNSGSSDPAEEDSSGKGSENEAQNIEVTQTPESPSGSPSDSESKNTSFLGVVVSINGNIVVVNGQITDIRSAEIKGTPRVGASVKVNGYYNSEGLFIVTKIEFQSSGSSGSGSNSNEDGSNSNGSSDDTNGDDNDNGGDDGGGDSGGSGGGSGDD